MCIDPVIKTKLRLCRCVIDINMMMPIDVNLYGLY